MKFEDSSKQEVKDGDTILFRNEDSQESSGYSKRVTNLKLCFWSPNQNKYVPLSDISKDGIVSDCEKVRNNIAPLKEDL